MRFLGTLSMVGLLLATTGCENPLHPTSVQSGTGASVSSGNYAMSALACTAAISNASPVTGQATEVAFTATGGSGSYTFAAVNPGGPVSSSPSTLQALAAYQSFLVTYSAAGSYGPAMRVYDSAGAQATCAIAVRVGPAVSCTAAISNSNPIAAQLTEVAFTATGGSGSYSFAPVNPGGPVSLPPSPLQVLARYQSFLIAYSAPGSYGPAMTVTDNVTQATSSCAVAVAVASRCPVVAGGIIVSLAGLDSNIGTVDSPLQTIPAAIALATQCRSQGSPQGPIYIRQGLYSITQTIVINPQDSGTAQYPLVISSYPGDTEPILSGALAFNNGDNGSYWQPTTLNTLAGPVQVMQYVFQGSTKVALQQAVQNIRAQNNQGAYAVTEVFAGQTRLTRSRYPQVGAVADMSLIHGAFPNCADVECGRLGQPVGMMNVAIPSSLIVGNGTEVVYSDKWNEIRALVANAGTYPTETWLVPAVASFDEINAGTAPVNEHIHLENNVLFLAPDQVGKPGMWYFDQDQMVLYVVPTPGLSFNQTFFIPLTYNLFRLNGSSPQNTVNNVTFNNLGIAFTNWRLQNGHTNGSGNSSYYAFFAGGNGLEGAVVGNNVEFLSVNNCDIFATGAYGFRLGNWLGGIQVGRPVSPPSYVTHIKFTGNRFTDLGGGAFDIDNRGGPFPTDFQVYADSNIVTNPGVVFGDTIAMFFENYGMVAVRYNQINNAPYSGIALQTPCGISPTDDGEILGNTISAMNYLQDGGGIYINGVHSRVYQNVITPIPRNADAATPAGTAFTLVGQETGVYLDDDTKGTEVFSNFSDIIESKSDMNSISNNGNHVGNSPAQVYQATSSGKVCYYQKDGSLEGYPSWWPN